MNIHEFLDNPVGKGDASINVSYITQALSTKYEKYQSSNKKIEMHIYHQPLKDTYWIWMIIPSETERTNTYDVVFKFINPKPTNRVTLGIGKFDIQVFANSPSFAYTYAYVYNQNDMLISSLSGKLGRTFITKSPDVRNRNQNMLFDKYIYFGARYILDSKVLNRTVADTKASKYDEKYLNGHIRTLNTIMEEYRVAQDKLRGKHAKEKQKTKETKRLDTGSVNRISGTKASSKGINKNAKRKATVQKTRGTVKKK